MPLLLEDLAEETWVSNLRSADRLEEEAQELERLSKAESALDDLLKRIVESARQATGYVVSRMPLVETVWQAALAALREKPREQSIRLLPHLIRAFESALRLTQSARAFWTLPEEFKIKPERIDELDRAEEFLKQIAAEARAALSHRRREWQPQDPERLVRGLQSARERKTVTAEAALQSVRQPRG